MKNGCAALAAATLIFGAGLVPATVEAACNVRNPTACSPGTPQPAEAGQPQAAAQAATPQPQAQATAKPLQLKRYLTLGPARRTVSRSSKRQVVRQRTRGKTAKSSPKAPPQVTATASATAGADAALTRAIPTVAISARALAVTPTPDNRTVGFNAETAPWGGEGIFAYAAEAALPAGVIVARFDEFNEIDRAAGAGVNTAAPVAKSDSLTGVSLVTPANAAPAAQAAVHKAEQSWLSWLYGKVVDGVVTAALAIRSLFA